MVKPSLDEAFSIEKQVGALTFFESRSVRPSVTKEKRIEYAREIFQNKKLKIKLCIQKRRTRLLPDCPRWMANDRRHIGRQSGRP